METAFERMVRAARAYGPELVESMMEIVRGEARVQLDALGQETLIPVRDADRISAAKLIAGILLHKDALQVKGEDAFESLSPYEKKRLIKEALDEVENEIKAFQ